MSFNMDDVQIGGQLRVGTGICNPIKEGDYKINGTAHIEGPMVVGNGAKINLVLLEEILMIKMIIRVQHQLI